MTLEMLTPTTENKPHSSEKELSPESIRNSLKEILLSLKQERDSVISESAIEERDRLENYRKALERHEKNVIEYASTICQADGLSDEEIDLVLIATQLHDCAKLTAPLLEHHLASADLAEHILKDKEGGSVRGVTINDQSIHIITDAIRRHQNHPFLVAMNNGKRFAEPKTDVDRVVFDADMLSNIGFKNVTFRLNSPDFLAEDIKNAQSADKVLIETFNNVLNSMADLPEIVLNTTSRKIATIVLTKVRAIFEAAKPDIIDCQKKYSKDDKFNIDTIEASGGVAALIQDLNTIIQQAAASINEQALVKNIQI